MNDVEKREAARQFINKWKGKGKEDEDDRSYWIDILSKIMEVSDVTDHIDFQKKVIVDDNTKRIDAYLPDTKVLIEQKTLGIALDKKIKQSGGIELTPYEQAKRYNDNLPFDEKARWIVTSNFAEIWIYDMNMRVPEPVKLEIENLQAQYSVLDFLIEEETKSVNLEMEVSLQAGDLVGILYDAFLNQYKDKESEETLKSLNKLCVRIVFCLYAEDAGIFGKRNMFHDYLKQFNANTARKGLSELFKVLDQKPEDRDTYLADDDPLLAAFPYVNGGLFADEDIEVPPLTDEILQMLLDNASDDFDWSKISPTIFGAVFESTLNPETRHAGGMHYTSIENIHKVIDPLFLDELKDEFDQICKVEVLKTKEKKLREFQKKLGELSFLDPACGSGNFLTETYLSLRRLENKILIELSNGQISIGTHEINNPIQVSINNFYGIEINDFAVTVAKTALWIAESQMIKETENIILMPIDFLPLTTNAYIVEGNALQIDWEDVVPKNKLNYVMGNPPFIGHQMRNEQQVKDMKIAFHDFQKHGKLDYVCAWYNKAADYIKGTDINVAFVSTNSICQGESVPLLWNFLIEKKNVEIQFAYRTFIWDSEATTVAHVHCVIIGFNCRVNNYRKLLFDENDVKQVECINGYLVDAPNTYVQPRGKCLTTGLPEMHKGSQATDGLGLIIEPNEYESFISKYPNDIDLIRPYMGSYEFINDKKRYCLWLSDVAPDRYRKNTFISTRLAEVSNFRKTSATASVRDMADSPAIFTQIRQPDTEYLAFPAMSSSRRKYIPIGYLSSNIIASNQLYVVPNASLYMFGVLTSNVHMAWTKTVCGRLKSDIRYAPALYNNFPWPNPNDAQKKRIEESAQAILEARSMFESSSLADLYDPLAMPLELRKAHQANDRAVMDAYGLNVKKTTEADCVAELMKMYQKLTEKEK